jgi:hypothetical protein
MEFKLFPWENGIKPDFINEKGYEWYKHKDLTKWAQDKINSGNPLKAVCFIIKKDNFMEYVLVGTNQTILEVDSSLEGMAVKIDVLRSIG